MDSTTTSKTGQVIDLGRIRYGPAWDLQKKLHSQRVSGQIPDTLLLLEHEPVITLGKSAQEANLLVSRSRLQELGIEIFRIERGGDITYHGPGQLVGYPIFLLAERLIGIKRFVENVEQSIISCLARFGIEAGRKPKMVGVWVEDRKIASIGVAVKQRVTFHGFALNVNTDLNSFSLMTPCGLPGVKMTSMQQELKKPITIDQVKAGVRDAVSSVFGLALEDKKLDTGSFVGRLNA